MVVSNIRGFQSRVGLESNVRSSLDVVKFCFESMLVLFDTVKIRAMVEA